LAAGKLADIVIFDSNINVQMTIVKGKIVYNNEL
jgi:N-acetylglucosamine-6-phosphate deacetylase